MYLQSLKLTLRLYPTVLAVVLGELVIWVFAERGFRNGQSLSFAIPLLYTYMAFNSFDEILISGWESRKAVSTGILGFGVRCIGLFVLIFGLSMVLSLLLFSVPGIKVSIGDSFESFFILFLPSAGFVGLFILGLLGSWLPAYVADRGRGFGKAISRGKSTFWFVTGLLIVGPGITIVVIIMAHSIGSIHLGYSDLLFQPNWIPNIFSILFFIVMKLFFAWAVIMATWIFSMAFLKTEASQSEAQT